MTTHPSFLIFKKWLLYPLLILVFGAGFVIRLYDLFDAPLDFHPTRQMHSVLIARGMYFEQRDDVPDWQRELAVQQWKAEPHPEPQILERLTALTYQVIGNEVLWVARLYSILFWMAGGVGLFLLAKSIIGIDGALIALVYYLFLPYGAIASRSFQPDPMLVCSLIFTCWAIHRWYRQPSWKNAILAGILGGLAIFVKAVAVFFVAGAWIGLLFATRPLRQMLRDKQIWLIALLSILPYAGFYAYGTLLKGFLQGEFGLRFFPQLWKDPVFFLQWNGELSSVVGFEWFLIALVSSLLIKERGLRGFLLGLWGAYFVYGMTFAYHISTHDYYQLPLIPLVALGLGAAGQVLFKHLQGKPMLRYALVSGVVLFFIVIKAWDVRVTLKRNEYSNEIRFWENLGGKLGQDVSVVGLLQDSGARLAYWGWVEAEDWFSTGDFNVRTLAGQEVDVQNLFEQKIQGRDYFVVTILQELNRQPELVNLLTPYTILEQTDDYIIYDLNDPIPTQ